MPKRRPWGFPSTQLQSAWLRFLVAAVLLGVTSALALTGSAATARLIGRKHGPRVDSPRRFESRGVSPLLRDRLQGRVRVLLVLAGDPVVQTAVRTNGRTALTAQMSRREVQSAGRRPRTAGRAIAYRHERERQTALRRLQPAVDRAVAQERPVIDAVRALGGRILGREALVQTLTADMPTASLRVLAARPDVRAIEPATIEREQSLTDSTGLVGAPSFWGAGFTGGRGHEDRSPIDLAIIADKVQEDHPAFAGIAFQRPSDSDVGTPCGVTDGCDHGTSVASLAISRGAQGCGKCAAGDESKRGVAPGLDTVLDGSVNGVDEGAWALGLSAYGRQGAADPAEIFSDSHGSNTTLDDAISLQNLDKLVSAYGILDAKPAGNEGPGQAVNTGCIAYDSLCMGAFRQVGSYSPSDSQVADFSSRGPTPGGRKKPDLLGVGVTEYAERRWWLDGFSLWNSRLEGTSFATPQGAAGAALLAGSGISDPLAQKAILIDSARRGRATPTDPMGTQVGWQPDWGWGALDLDGALRERANFQTDGVPGGGVRFYRATAQAAGDRATLVWNRRAVGCAVPGCDTTALTLTNLDLEQLDPATGAVLPSPQPSGRPAGVEPDNDSTKDNVEQVRSPGAGDLIYKVKAASTVDGLPAEPFALAANRPLTALAAPQPTVAVSVDRSEVLPGDPVTVTATVANPSPDLSAEAARVTLDLPASVELEPGAIGPVQSLGTLAEAGRPGSRATVTWTVRGTADGLHQLTARADASRYGETFSSTTARAVRVDGTAPSVGLSAPSGTTTNPRVALAWDAVDAGVGGSLFDVEVAEDEAPWRAWLGGTAETSATYTATVGHRYRFRVRAADRLGNTSPFTVSDLLGVVAPPPGTREGPRLRLGPARPRGAFLALPGTVDARASGWVRCVLTGRIGRRTIRMRASAAIRRGAFVIELWLRPSLRRLRGTRIVVTYDGDSRFGPQVARRVIRR